MFLDCVVQRHAFLRLAAPCEAAPCCDALRCGLQCCAVVCCVVLCCVVLGMLCCGVLCCAVFGCAVLRCAVLCCDVLSCAAMWCAVLCVLRWTGLRWALLCYDEVWCFELRCAVVCCAVICYAVLCCVLIRQVSLRLACTNKSEIQINRQYVAMSSLGGPDGVLARKESLKKWAAIQEARRSGRVVTDTPNVQSKMQRMKTYVSTMCFANMLQGMGSSLAKFQVLELDDGTLPDPYTWAHVNFCPDRGSDMVCMDHALKYKFMINSHADQCKDHGTQRMSVGSMKTAGMYAHQVII